MVANHILLRIAVLPAQPSISTSPALHICVIGFQEKIKHKQSHNPYCPAVITVVLVNNVINQQMHISISCNSRSRLVILFTCSCTFTRCQQQQSYDNQSQCLHAVAHSISGQTADGSHIYIVQQLWWRGGRVAVGPVNATVNNIVFIPLMNMCLYTLSNHSMF